MSRTTPARAHTFLPMRAYAILLIALVVGLTGMIADNGDLMRCANLLAILGVPPLIVGHIKRAHTVQDDQLADAHRAGYQLALEHVARGLLDQHSTVPPDGWHEPAELLEGSNVRRLHAVRNNHERRAG